MNKFYFEGITKKQSQSGKDYYLLCIWSPASYNGIDGQRDMFYYIVDELAYEVFKSIETNQDISDIITFDVTENSTKITINGKEYQQKR